MQPQYTPAFLERFWLKVDRNGPIPEHRPELGPCWLWTACTSYGYGQTSFRGKGKRAHRVSYESEVGQIPEGFDIDHLCRVHACVRPSHLEAVTHIENVRRGLPFRSPVLIRKKPYVRRPLPEKCLRGHSDWRMRIRRGMVRQECRQCQKIYKRTSMLRQKALRND